jgi:hypothetical protein
MSSFYDSRIVVLNNIRNLIVYIVKTRNYGKLKVVDLYNPKSFPIFQIKKKLHHVIVLSNYIIFQVSRNFIVSFPPIAHPKYNNVGGIPDA